MSKKTAVKKKPLRNDRYVVGYTGSVQVIYGLAPGYGRTEVTPTLPMTIAEAHKAIEEKLPDRDKTVYELVPVED